LPWRRPDNAGLRAGLSRGRGAAPLGPDVKPGPRGWPDRRNRWPPGGATARPVAASARAHRQIQSVGRAVGCGSDRTQNIQFGAPRASRLGDQVAAPNGGYMRGWHRLVDHIVW